MFDEYDPKLRRFLGVITLCMAAMTTLLSLGFVGISFATDNWKHISVNRPHLKLILDEKNLTESANFDLEKDHKYFDRVEGLFRVCFPMIEKPKKQQDDKIYLSPFLSEWCVNIEYFMEDFWAGDMDKMTYFGNVYLNLARATIGAFITYFAIMGLTSVMGLMGCYQMSEAKLIWTASLMLFAFFFGAAGMGLFHATDFFERHKVSF